MIRLFSLMGGLALCLLLFWTASPVYAEGDETYVVRPGDTLSSIAAQYGISAGQLAEANDLQWNSRIYVGQQLTIPQTGPVAVSAANRVYTVRPGDTLANIAYNHGLTAADLQAANGLANANQIVPGQELIIPANGATGLPAARANEPILIDLHDGDWIEIEPPHQSWVPDYPDRIPVTAPAQQQPAAASTQANGEKWIDVNLTTQSLTAYEGQTPVYTALVSSGLARYPTVVGTYSIYVKYTSARMRGGYGADYYDLPNVPYVMYFHQGYGLHGTYWHSNFGAPMSHGCVNLATPDAEWLFNWAEVGTKVVTHY